MIVFLYFIAILGIRHCTNCTALTERGGLFFFVFLLLVVWELTCVRPDWMATWSLREWLVNGLRVSLIMFFRESFFQPQSFGMADAEVGYRYTASRDPPPPPPPLEWTSGHCWTSAVVAFISKIWASASIVNGVK